jgi:hypothetical protein
MEGGRFVSSGSYACIFTPPLLCKSGLKKDSKLLGKVTSIDELNQELKIGNRLRRFPLAKNYFVIPEPESCELLPASKQKDPGVKECLEDSEKFRDLEKKYGDMFPPQQIKQLFEPFGGDIPLFQFTKQISENKVKLNLYKMMEHLLEAGAVMLLVRMCHFDLHPGNLLVDKHNVVRIIDFGLSFETDKITKELIEAHMVNKPVIFGSPEEIADHETVPEVINSEPPELTVLLAISNGYNTKDAIVRTAFSKPAFRKVETYLGRSLITTAEEMESFFSTSKSFKNKDYVGLWKTYWTGFDAWSIGCLCFDFFQMFLYRKDFINGPYRKQKPFIVNTLRGLLHPNPKKRLDCFEALSVLNPNSAFVERYGKEWLDARKKQRGS